MTPSIARSFPHSARCVESPRHHSQELAVGRSHAILAGRNRAMKRGTMLHVVAVIRFQPQHIDAGCEAMVELAKRSRSEAGCLRYDVFRPGTDPLVVTQEIWQDAATEDAHMKGPNVAALIEKMGGALAAPPEIHRCQQLA
jgi:quinol monooxygenase YgiN